MTNIRNGANSYANADKIDLLKIELLQYIDICRAKAGCIQYDLQQDNDGSAPFSFPEISEMRDLWQTHGNAPHPAANKVATDSAVKAFTRNEMTQSAEPSAIGEIL